MFVLNCLQICGGRGGCVCIHVDCTGFSLQGFFLMVPTREQQTQDVGRSCRDSIGRKAGRWTSSMCMCLFSQVNGGSLTGL